jgi:membrane protein
MNRPALYGAVVKRALQGFVEDRGPSMGASLAYYTLFSLAPLLLIVIAVVGAVFGGDAARGQIVAQLAGLVGADTASSIEQLIVSADQPVKGWIASSVGVLLMLIGATTVFAELQSSLDQIWRAPAPPATSGLWALLRSRLLSFGLILGVGFLLIVSLVVSAGMAVFNAWWSPWFEAWAVVGRVLDGVINFALLTALFAMIYKWMPRVRVAWRDVLVGAACTSLLFMLGRALIGLYIGTSSVASAFGAAGSVVAVMVWIYYSAQIFLIGAEFTWAYSQIIGSRRPLPRP